VKDYSEGVLPNHKSMNWAPVFPLELREPEQLSTYGPGYGRWRLEVVPTGSAPPTTFSRAEADRRTERGAASDAHHRDEDAFGVEISAAEKRSAWCLTRTH